MDSPLVLLLIGLLFIALFGALSFIRRQGLSLRFALEGLAVTALALGARLFLLPVNPFLFLGVLYLVTMRVRLLVDVGNWLARQGHYERAMGLYDLALRLGPDQTGRQIAQINRGAALLCMGDPEAARRVLQEALGREEVRIGAQYQAAGHYNLGLACLRSGREAEGVHHLNQAIDILPYSVYGRAAARELERRRTGRKE